MDVFAEPRLNHHCDIIAARAGRRMRGDDLGFFEARRQQKKGPTQ